MIDKILVVNDNPDFRTIIPMHLEDLFGFPPDKITTPDSYRGALQAVEQLRMLRVLAFIDADLIAWNEKIPGDPFPGAQLLGQYWQRFKQLLL